MTITGYPQGAPDAFRHEALLYEGLDGFVGGTLPFICGAIEAGEPILVVVSAEKIELIRSALGSDAGRVFFGDMRYIGANPARIIPAWYDFVDEHASGRRRIRGIGEPISSERSPDALVECQRHESLLNLAFADTAPWWLLCPYDTTALHPSVIDEALASHPFVLESGAHRGSDAFRDLDVIAKPFDHPLPLIVSETNDMTFAHDQLDIVRKHVAKHARTFGLDHRRTADLVLAVDEIASNSLRHGGGEGTFRMWTDSGRLICEVRDAGVINKPLAGRRRPNAGQEGGFGMWLVHQLCDLVQVRTFDDGSVVRLHMTLA